jgi:hypothetical protein
VRVTGSCTRSAGRVTLVQYDQDESTASSCLVDVVSQEWREYVEAARVTSND